MPLLLHILDDETQEKELVAVLFAPLRELVNEYLFMFQDDASGALIFEPIQGGVLVGGVLMVTEYGCFAHPQTVRSGQPITLRIMVDEAELHMQVSYEPYVECCRLECPACSDELWFDKLLPHMLVEHKPHTILNTDFESYEQMLRAFDELLSNLQDHNSELLWLEMTIKHQRSAIEEILVHSEQIEQAQYN
jgi:hypothetical protein